MDMQASRQLAVTQQQAWDALNDPEVLKLCIPGCDKVEATEPGRYLVGMAVKIGPVSARVQRQDHARRHGPAQRATRSASMGRAAPPALARERAKVALLANDAGCELGYTVHARWVARSRSWASAWSTVRPRSMAEDFFKRFDDEMLRRFPPPAAPAPLPVFVPGSKLPTWVWIAGAVVLLLAWWLAR
jgi:carbon monoxide dehydrogenase subunit G